MYLPKQATIEQSCDWLQAKTGETWVLARLLESGAVPSFWLDYSPDWPAIVFGGRKEGYLASMPFAGDTERLATEGNDALVTMFYSHDGELVAPTPGLRVALADLRFSREDVEDLAPAASRHTAPACATVSEPERRLARLRTLGGDAKYKHGNWKITEIVALTNIEKSEGRGRSDQKTIRIDIKEAAQHELDAKRAGLFDGMLSR